MNDLIPLLRVNMLLYLLYLHSNIFKAVTVSDRVTPLVNGSLRISSIRSEDAGFYKCRATNEFGVDFVDYNLVVFGELHIIHILHITPLHTIAV